MNMNNIETNSNEAMHNTKPMFASTWMVLFTELRKNYNERNLVDHKNKERMKAIQQNRPGLK